MGHAHCRPGRDRSVQSAYRLRFCRDRAEILNQRATTPTRSLRSWTKLALKGMSRADPYLIYYRIQEQKNLVEIVALKPIGDCSSTDKSASAKNGLAFGGVSWRRYWLFFPASQLSSST